MKNKKIQRITAVCNKVCDKPCQRKFTWERSMIGNIIENIPKLIERDGFWKDVKIERS